jgi:hypothetical protein
MRTFAKEIALSAGLAALRFTAAIAPRAAEAADPCAMFAPGDIGRALQATATETRSHPMPNGFYACSYRAGAKIVSITVQRFGSASDADTNLTIDAGKVAAFTKGATVAIAGVRDRAVHVGNEVWVRRGTGLATVIVFGRSALDDAIAVAKIAKP